MGTSIKNPEMFEEIVAQNLSREERIARNESRVLDKQEDLKIDINLELSQSKEGKERGRRIRLKHRFIYKTIEKQDILLMQAPNINESGYYSGIVALKSFMKKYNSDISVKIIDPVIDYFYANPPDKKSKFLADFNTFNRPGEFWILFGHEEIYKIFEYICFYIDKAKPRFFGFSTIDGNIDATLALSKLVKEKYPKLKVMIGGNGVQMMKGGLAPSNNYDIDHYHWLDYIVRGDGEHTLTELVNSDESPESLMKIQGLIWKDRIEKINEDTIQVYWNVNFKRTETSMDILPYPDYSDLRDNYYYKKSYGDSTPLLLSRGCPYRCTFCSVPTFVPLFRYRPLENVIEEMEHWVKRRKRSFFCHDSIVNGDPVWLKNFCETIINKGWGDGYVKWGGNFRLQKPMRDIETLKLYNKAGAEWMISGLESASEPVLKHMKKYGSMRGTREIFENIREVNKNNKRPIKVMLQLIIGYLNESDEDFQKTMDFVEEFHDVIHMVLTCSLFLLWPPLLKQWEEEGEYIDFKSGVEWTTKYNNTEKRLERAHAIEKLFKKSKIDYNIYHRGIYEAEIK
jgi:organic radical activating enzyme